MQCEYITRNMLTIMKKKGIYLFLLSFFSFSLADYAQNPRVTIQERIHTPCPEYVNQGWDTATNRIVNQIMLNVVLPAQEFNGTYLVESIPYNPPEPFNAGDRMSPDDDDVWDSQGPMDIVFPFQFFGETQTSLYVGVNGLISFNNAITAGMATGYGWDWFYPINATALSPTAFPWTNTILGVACDVNPEYIPAGDTNRGIFKYSGGIAPFRHIAVSWNEVPVWGYESSQATTTCTHQVVLYENTNIIEVHVKKHHNPNAIGGSKSAIGIINAEGTAAFMAPGRNPFQTVIDSVHAEAWRFTPQSTTTRTVSWYKMTTSGGLVEVGENSASPNTQWAEAYYASSDHTSCVVFPSSPTTYKVKVNFIDELGHSYILTDTIRVGVDTNVDYTIQTPQLIAPHHAAACHRTTGEFTLSSPTSCNVFDSVSWRLTQIRNGQITVVDDESYIVSEDGLSMQFAPIMNMQFGATDTFYVYTTAVFGNGVARSDSLLFEVYPVYINDYQEVICAGQTFEMWGEQYGEAGSYMHNFSTVQGCDSIEVLQLSLDYGDDEYLEVLLTDDELPYHFGNESFNNYGSYDVVLTNTNGCDSTIHLTLVHTESIEDPVFERVSITLRNGRIIVVGAEGHRVTVSDILGRTLFSALVTESVSIDVPSAGIYLLQIDNLPTRRLAIMH